MKFAYSDYLDGECTREEYHAQFNPIQLKVGKQYVQAKDTWRESVYKVLIIIENIAMVKEVKGTSTAIGFSKYDLFYAETGFKYNDNRIEAYQLKEII